jgi:hypothetical protein
METNNNSMTEIDDKTCLICWDTITCNTWAKCMWCNILLHDICETTYRTGNNRKYCQCPHCQRVGTLGRIYKIE